MQDVVSSFAWI